jgi:hypothetical protein
MPYTERISEVMYPLATYNADALGVGTFNSAYVLLRDYHRAWLVINVGDMGGGGTLDAGIQQATDTAGTGVKAIAGKTITQLTQAGGDSNSLVCIELQTEELDVSLNFDAVRFYLTVGGAATEVSATLYGAITRFVAVPTTNWQEIVG